MSNDDSDPAVQAYRQALRRRRLAQDWAQAARDALAVAGRLDRLRNDLARQPGFEIADDASAAIAGLRAHARQLCRLADAQAWREHVAVESMAVPLSAALREAKASQLRGLLTRARDLTDDPGDVNPEYVRGQADLIYGACALPGPYDLYQELLTGAISHELTVDTAITAICELMA